MNEIFLAFVSVTPLILLGLVLLLIAELIDDTSYLVDNPEPDRIIAIHSQKEVEINQATRIYQKLAKHILKNYTMLSKRLCSCRMLKHADWRCQLKEVQNCDDE